MEVISKIIKQQTSLLHQILIISILLQTQKVPDPQGEQKKQLAFLELKYQELISLLSLWEHHNSNLPEDDRVTYNQIVNSYETVNASISEIKNELYSQFKAMTLVILDNKSNHDLQEFQIELQELIVNYGDLKKAAEYLYYHVGDFLSMFSGKIIDFILRYGDARGQRVLPLNYFKQKQAIITLEVREWMEYYNNARFVLKYLPVQKENMSLLQHYNRLEMTYFVIMINQE